RCSVGIGGIGGNYANGSVECQMFANVPDRAVSEVEGFRSVRACSAKDGENGCGDDLLETTAHELYGPRWIVKRLEHIVIEGEFRFTVTLHLIGFGDFVVTLGCNRVNDGLYALTFLLCGCGFVY